MAQPKYWIWLTSLEGLRPISMRRVLERFGGPMEVYFAPTDGYEDIQDLSDREKALLRNKDLSRTDRVLDVCQEKRIRILTLQDAQYPERLREIPDPPPVLYVRGTLPFLDEIPVIGVVGTRKASPYGIKMAIKISQEITTFGGCVVTGMASGIDGAAAKGALLANGVCVGVLGTAIDVNYPKENSLLIDDVAAIGALISEFPPGYPTMPENFPRRNRIISGLSCGVCVVEAPKKSGALITADLALEQGRDLFAVPGNADSPNSQGTIALIRDCARAVTCGRDILEEYEGLYPTRLDYEKQVFVPEEPAAEPKETAKSEIDKPERIEYIDLERRLAAFTENQQKILRLLAEKDSHVDELIASTGFSPAKILADLTILSIRGAVKALPGKRYTLNLK